MHEIQHTKHYSYGILCTTHALNDKRKFPALIFEISNAQMYKTTSKIGYLKIDHERVIPHKLHRQ